MSFVVYLFLCFSLMHACSARPLGIIDDNKENGLLISAKDAKLSKMEEFSVKEKLQAENGASISLVITGDGAVSMAETIEASEKIDDQEDKGGNEVSTFSLQEFLHEKLEIIKGSQKRARSTLESLAQSAEEEVNTTGDNDPVEDAVVMDYAQPHRKPPIHNR